MREVDAKRILTTMKIENYCRRRRAANPDAIAGHMGPGPHPGTGTPQLVHRGLTKGGTAGMLQIGRQMKREDWSAYKSTARERAAKTAPAPRGLGPIGHETVAYGTDPNRQYKMRARLVSLDDIITSNTPDGRVDPRYPVALQPRLRDRTASLAQVDAIAKNLVPAALVTDFHALQTGAPIVGSDLATESGNGRLMALRHARENYPERWKAYQDALEASLEEYGFSQNDLAKVKNAVLVRERLGDTDRTEFAREANTASTLSMSPIETAKVDASRLTADQLSRLDVREEEGIDQALRSPRNGAFVKSFMSTMEPTERAALMRRDGTLSRQGLWRVKAAVFSRVFPNEAGNRLSEVFLESLDSNVRNFENALGATLPRLAQASALLASGRRPAHLDLSEDISKSIDMLARLKETGMPVDHYLGQAHMFERELSPVQERLLRKFDQVSRSPKKIKAVLEKYADLVLAQPDPGQATMFGVGSLTYDQLIDQVLSVEVQ